MAKDIESTFHELFVSSPEINKKNDIESAKSRDSLPPPLAKRERTKSRASSRSPKMCQKDIERSPMAKDIESQLGVSSPEIINQTEEIARWEV
jgi:hypothetical protein